jgi:hypothetical protein
VAWTDHIAFALPTAIALAAWVYRTRGPVRHAVSAIALSWTLCLTLGTIWFAPHYGNREFDHRGVEILLGNSYAIASATAIVLALALTRPALYRRTAFIDS